MPKKKKRTKVETLQANCRECNWSGPEEDVRPDQKTAKDTCPNCLSYKISYIETPKKGKTKAVAKKKPEQLYERCYSKHPALDLYDGLVIYGGSCITPVVTDADIYIGFDHGMTFTPRSFPWNPGYDVPYFIQDRGVPKIPQNFKRLVEWTVEQIEDGQKVHAGCIGGHGRTGMFLAAVVAQLGVADDAVGYVREHYCNRAVESREQCAFLMNEFNVAWSAPSKSSWGAGSQVKTNAKTAVKKGGVYQFPQEDDPSFPGSTAAGEVWADSLKGWHGDDEKK